MMEEIKGTEILHIDGQEIRLGHTWHEVSKIKEILDFYKPNLFVEVGVHEGGLSSVLIPEYYEKLLYVGIELNCVIIKPYPMELFHRYETVRLFCKSYEEYSFGVPIPKMVYCDNGNKPAELRYFSAWMNPGDILMAHDFFEGQVVVGLSYEEIHPEVSPTDVRFLDENLGFQRLPQRFLDGTRIIGYQRL